MRRCRNSKKQTQTSRERRSGGKVLERQPYIFEIRTLHVLQIAPLSASIDYPFLKDRTPRICNPTVSPDQSHDCDTVCKGRGIISNGANQQYSGEEKTRGSILIQDIPSGVDRNAVYSNFIMKMGTC
jgi:hypothetical protein